VTSPDPGIYHGIANSIYRAWPYLSYSALKKVDISPEQYAYDKEHPKPPSKAMMLGSAVDCIALTPDLTTLEIAITPDCSKRGKDNVAIWEKWFAENDGKVHLSRDDFVRAKLMAARALRHREAAKLFAEGEAQVCIVWDDAETGIRLKCRIDWVAEDMLVDLKTCGVALSGKHKVDADEFARQLDYYGYHLQAALYSDAFHAATGERRQWTWVVVSSEPPHRVKVYFPNATTLVAGRMAYRRALYSSRTCVREDSWVDRQIAEPISLPAFRLRAEGLEVQDGFEF